jgi:hypothetical protein
VNPVPDRLFLRKHLAATTTTTTTTTTMTRHQNAGKNYNIKVKGKAIPVTGREGPEGFETSRLPQSIDNRLTDGDESVSPTRRPPFTPRKIPDTHLC